MSSNDMSDYPSYADYYAQFKVEDKTMPYEEARAIGKEWTGTRKRANDAYIQVHDQAPKAGYGDFSKIPPLKDYILIHGVKDIPLRAWGDETTPWTETASKTTSKTFKALELRLPTPIEWTFVLERLADPDVKTWYTLAWGDELDMQKAFPGSAKFRASAGGEILSVTVEGQKKELSTYPGELQGNAHTYYMAVHPECPADVTKAADVLQKMKKMMDEWYVFKPQADPWLVRQQKYVAELAVQKEPYYKEPTDMTVDGGSFGAKDVPSSAGYLNSLMSTTLKTGNRVPAILNVMEVQSKSIIDNSSVLDAMQNHSQPFDNGFRKFDVLVEPTAELTPDGEALDDYLTKLKTKDCELINEHAIVQSLFTVTQWSDGGRMMITQKSGVTKLGIKFDGKSTMALADFDQYNPYEGQETMPVHYSV